MNTLNRRVLLRSVRTAAAMAASVVALVCLGAAPADAAGGSHFLAELNTGFGFPLGYTADYAPGLAIGGTLGFGGKFKGNPTRFYLIGQFNTTGFTAETTYNQKQRTITRQITDVNGGLRMLWPIDRHLRVFADVTLGFAQVDSEATSPDLPPNIRVTDVDSDFALFTGGGVQYRFAYNFSLGAKADFAFIYDEDATDAVAAWTGDGAGGDRTGRLNLYLTGTLHF